jgi:protein-L-isoaspartate O-methyltransferase
MFWVYAFATVLPEALVEQLKPGGRMVIPVGTMAQVSKISLNILSLFLYQSLNISLILSTILTQALKSISTNFSIPLHEISHLEPGHDELI